MATTTLGSGQERGNGVTRRGFLRWVGSVAAAGALAAVGVNGQSESAHSRRRGKKRRARQNDEPQPATTRAIEASVLAPDQADGDLAYAGTWCHWQVVCYPNGVCRRRRVCW